MQQVDGHGIPKIPTDNVATQMEIADAMILSRVQERRKIQTDFDDHYYDDIACSLINNSSKRKDGVEGENREKKKKRAGLTWDSERARQWVNPVGKDSARECIERRIKKLEEYLASSAPEENIHDVISATKLDLDKRFTQRIFEQAIYLRRALKDAIDLMYKEECKDEDGNYWTWTAICQNAINKINDVTQINRIIDSESLMRWYCEFRVKDCFLSPEGTKQVEPKIFSVLPTLKQYIIHWIRNNRQKVSVDNLHDAIHDELLPKAYEDYKKEEDKRGPVYSLPELLECGGLKSLCASTVHRWMKVLGCGYKEAKKSYYTDKHEDLENITYREMFIALYFGHEIEAYRWIQLPEKAVQRYKAKYEKMNKNFPWNTGYEFKSCIGFMHEYHIDVVDDDDMYKEFVPEENRRWGGNRSVRAKTKSR